MILIELRKVVKNQKFSLDLLASTGKVKTEKL